MANYKRDDNAQMVMMPVALERPLMPGTRECALQELLQRRRDTSIFDRLYRREETGCPASDPKMVLKVM